MEIVLTKDNFENEVLNSNIPVLVDFWATWCGPCQMLAPELEQLAAENEQSLKIGKINVDEQRELAMQFKISSIPTLMLFKDGTLAETVVGYRTKSQLEDIIK